MAASVIGAIMVRNLLKWAASKIPVDVYQRLLAYSVSKNEFSSVYSCPVYGSREALWSSVIDAGHLSDKKITYVEFGVFEGYSIKSFATKNKHIESRFFGLDSFSGLPEDWGSMKSGTFSTSGAIPTVDDDRIRFIKGWFQNSWSELQQVMVNRELQNLIVHYDADLYSSTLFALTKMDTLCRPYIAIFDEFAGHETRALFNYCQAYGATVKFMGKTEFNGHPNVVACFITPSTPSK